MLEFINRIKLNGQVVYIKTTENENSYVHKSIEKQTTEKDIEGIDYYISQCKKERQ